jgi:short subunit dehydrogenase-like uncharacterized protein
MPDKILVYGSYGYTGDLIVRFAKEDDVDVVLSGRNSERLTHVHAGLRGDRSYRVDG